ncbi:cytochrome P450, partial [Phyllosticta citrichinensis]
LIQGVENIKKVLKQSSSSSSSSTFIFVLRKFFAMPAKASNIYVVDDSGIAPQPNETSTIEPHNRINFITHRGLAKLLTGPGLGPLVQRFEQNLSNCILELNVNEQWTAVDDLLQWFKIDVTNACLDTMGGPILLSVDPEFAQNFWGYSSCLPWMSKGLPRFMNPRAHALRDSLFASVKEWHRIARESWTESDVSADGETDRVWGCKFFRERHQEMLQVDNYDHDAIAAQDFAALWDFNHNIVLAIFWSILEIFRDLDLLQRVRDEVAVCQNDSASGFDTQKLVRQPLLQSIFAETLRLRVNTYISRSSGGASLTTQDWHVPEGSTIFISSTPAHRDPAVWNEGYLKSHPLDTFWALVYPGEPFSEPTKRTAPDDQAEKRHGPQFQLGPFLAGSWIPFGGGESMCPGRHLAKKQLLMTCAIMVRDFDIQVLASREAMQMNWWTFGFGVQQPCGPVPILARRRA